MAIAMLIEFSGGTAEDYDRVLQRLDLGGKMAPGGIFHVVGPTDDGLRVVDVWDSQEAFDRFFEDKLRKALEAEGLPEPKISVWPVHNMIPG